MVVAIVASACASAVEAAPITFRPCGNLLDEQAVPEPRRSQLSYECGTLAVPVDHADPTGDRIDMQVVRVRSTQQHDRIGALVVNYGGPGGSGLEGMASWPGAVSDDILARFDLVSFDPRGTGRSAGIRCPGLDAPPDPGVDVATDAGFDQVLADDARRARECADRLGGRAQHYNTESTARDMDALRRALGDDKLTFVGYSYGATLGAEYADQFPDRVRAAVLDGPPDLALDNIALFEGVIAGFEDSFARYAAGCPTRPSCPGDPRQVLADLVQRAAITPIPAKKPGETRVAHPHQIIQGVIGFLYDDALWPYLDEALTAAATDSDSTEFFAIDDRNRSGTDDPAVAEPRHAGFVIGCNDKGPPPPDERIKEGVGRMIARFPVFGRWAAYGVVGCRNWQPARHELSRPTAQGAAPILVIGTRHDPATPYAGAVDLAKALSSGKLLTWNGDGHTAYHQSECIDRHVDAYLIRLALPTSDC
ncbi:alpha/beta hydrolase [Actinokineospora sp. HUAS TT18]|uniref:alpha/beta hydrolase n=1 Tax=Actinokineospora sp. HUAS TT18 TaxID=3447451 RepID=UPI003F5211FA